jgi:hypothetical protein
MTTPQKRRRVTIMLKSRKDTRACLEDSEEEVRMTIVKHEGTLMRVLEKDTASYIKG